MIIIKTLFYPRHGWCQDGDLEYEGNLANYPSRTPKEVEDSILRQFASGHRSPRENSVELYEIHRGEFKCECWNDEPDFNVETDFDLESAELIDSYHIENEDDIEHMFDSIQDSAVPYKVFLFCSEEEWEQLGWGPVESCLECDDVVFLK